MKSTLFPFPFHFELKTTKEITCLLLVLILLIGCSPRTETGRQNVALQTTASAGEVKPQTDFSSIHERGVLLVGTAISKPFEFHDSDSGELVGFDIDLVNYIADSLDVKPEFIEMSFANLIPALQENKVDLTIAAMYINPEREAQVDFSDPYVETGLVMVAHPDLLPEIISVDNLKSRKLGVKIGSTGASLARELSQQGYEIQVIEYKDTLDSFLDLEVNRVDVIFNDYLNSLSYIKNSGSGLKIVSDETGEPVFLSQAGLGIAVRQGNSELLGVVNAALKDMHQTGYFENIYEKWLLPTVDK